MKRLLAFSLIIAMMLIASIALSDIIRVPGDYPTIQEAIDAALPGDKVLVAAGTYEENITLKNGAEIIGAGADVTTITAPSGNIVTVGSAGLRTSIRGVTIDGQSSNDDGIYCSDSSPTISDVTIINTGDDGIYCNNSSPTISDVTIINTVTDGIDCDYYAAPTISNVTIINTGGYGIQCFDHSSPTISDAIISDAGNIGIHCYVYSSPTISNVTISGAGSEGIRCFTVSSPIISNCEIKFSGIYGIHCGDYSSPTIRGNIITQNRMDGIYSEMVGGESQPDIGTETEPGLNEIFNNGRYDVHSEISSEIKAELNWWGQAPPNPLFFFGNIDYEPWLTEPPFRGSINGHVADADTGNPITFAFVIAINSDTKDKYKTFTDSNGDYEIPDVLSGIYWVICIKKGYKAGIKKAEVVAGETTTVDFQLIQK